MYKNKINTCACRNFEETLSETLLLSGPIWQSHIQCVGDEVGLRWCPHRGFVDRYSDASWLLPLICDSHRDDASVFCFKNGTDLVYSNLMLVTVNR